MNMHSVLEKKIHDRYHNSDLLLHVIRQHDAEDFLNNVFQLIDTFTEQQSEKEMLNLAGIILTKLNELLLSIKNTDERRIIKYAITDIFKEDIRRVSKKLSPDFVPELINTLKTCSFLLNNNYKELESLLGLKRYNILKSKRFSNTKPPYYQWLGKDYELDELIRDLKDKQIIYSIKDFKKLFSPEQNTYYKANREKRDDLIIIFSILKELQLIKPKIKSGYLSPLIQFGLDKEENLLFTSAPNKLHYAIKQKGKWYEMLRENYLYWIRSIIPE